MTAQDEATGKTPTPRTDESLSVRPLGEGAPAPQRLLPLPEGYCVHGTYVGGSGPDYICGDCEHPLCVEEGCGLPADSCEHSARERYKIQQAKQHIAEQGWVGHDAKPYEKVTIKILCETCQRPVTLKGEHTLSFSDRVKVRVAQDKHAEETRIAATKPYDGAIALCQATIADAWGNRACEARAKWVRGGTRYGRWTMLVVCGIHRRAARVSANDKRPDEVESEYLP